MLDNKKQNVSIRMSGSDLQKIKTIARRLKVRNSDVFRFVISSSLEKLGPLYDETVTGSDLLPMMIECGIDISRYFQLDSYRLDSLINKGVLKKEKLVDKADLELFGLAMRQEQYLYARLKDFANSQDEPLGTQSLLKKYFFEKYIESEQAEPEIIDKAQKFNNLDVIS